MPQQLFSGIFSYPKFPICNVILAPSRCNKNIFHYPLRCSFNRSLLLKLERHFYIVKTFSNLHGIYMLEIETRERFQFITSKGSRKAESFATTNKINQNFIIFF